MEYFIDAIKVDEIIINNQDLSYLFEAHERYYEEQINKINNNFINNLAKLLINQYRLKYYATLNQLIRDNSGNKMSIVFCLHDIEHIELLYEENSVVWNLLDGSDKRQDVKDNEKVERDKMYLIIQKVMNRLGLVIPAIVFSLFIGALAYLMYYQFIPEVANVIDFIVAMMSVVVLIISYARSKMDERKQYLWVSSTYILLLTIGLIIFMVVAIKIKNVSSIARVLSCICLGITIIQEIIGITKIEHKINIEGEHKQEEKIKRMESESNT